MSNPFSRHPRSVGESYVEHMGQAWSFALPMVGAGLACLIHGLLPFAFERTGSSCIEALYARMTVRRSASRVSNTALEPEG